jgi:PAS domain S-box-containing protein
MSAPEPPGPAGPDPGLWRRLVDAAPDMVARVDRDLRLTFVNAALARAAGRAPAELLGRPLAEVPGLPGEATAEWTRRVREAFASGRPGADAHEVEGPEGVRAFEVRIVPEPVGGAPVTHLALWVCEVTDRVVAERAARAAAEASLDALFVLSAVRDAAGRVTDFRYEDVNARAAAMAATTPAGLRGRLLSEVLDPRGGEFVAEFAGVMAEGRPLVREVQMDDVPGVRLGWAQYQVVARPGGVAITARDITAQRRAEAGLRESAEAVERLAAEQGALRRVATAVARAAPPDELFDLVAREVAEQLPADGAAVFRYAGEGRVRIIGAWRLGGLARGHSSQVAPATPLARMRTTGRPTRAEDYRLRDDPVALAARALGFLSSVMAPVRVGGRIWGGVGAFGHAPAAFPVGAEDRLLRFSGLLALAIANAEAEEARRALLGELLGAEEAERRRIAADIHDDAVQVVSAAALRLGSLAEQPGPMPAEALRAVRADLREVAERLRTLLVDLEPPALGQAGLTGALLAHLAEVAARWGVAWRLEGGLEREPAPAVRSLAWRVAVEAVANARKHSGASELVVGLAERDEGIEVRVADDGAGFAPGAEEPSPGHRGIALMRERVRLAGGALDLVSAPGHGTVLTAWIPAP